VVNHIVGGTGFFAELAEKGAVTDSGDETDCTATDFAATFQREAERLVAAFRAPGAMTKPMKLPFGELPGSVCVWIAAGDIFTHGWDLAKATGQPTDLEPDVAARLLAQIEPILPDDMRRPGRGGGLRAQGGDSQFGPRSRSAGRVRRPTPLTGSSLGITTVAVTARDRPGSHGAAPTVWPAAVVPCTAMWSSGVGLARCRLLLCTRSRRWSCRRVGRADPSVPMARASVVHTVGASHCT
jgi:uncharacterized protein (TIGR03086 family)